jgi:arginyl-tRNA--protein-N-Asp/Glu arginylyltransferase
MKIFRSESYVDYKTYTFNYATYCIKEDQSEIPQIYAQGFLPYSNKVDLMHDTYYLARSLRVELSQFKESSENRRVARKIEALSPSFRVIPIAEFNVDNPEFKAYCLDFAAARFSDKISMERLNYILHAKSISHVFEFVIQDKKVGYVISIVEQGTLHYWFAFFDLNLQEYALGKWMMFSVIKWAHEQNLSYVYLGTCYGEKSLYKVRDFKGLSYFNGNFWDRDMKNLKAKCKQDHAFTTDEFKQDTDLFLERMDQDKG